MTMAKATTNGIVPFGVVACKEEIYDAVMDNSPKGANEFSMVTITQEYLFLLQQR